MKRLTLFSGTLISGLLLLLSGEANGQTKPLEQTPKESQKPYSFKQNPKTPKDSTSPYRMKIWTPPLKTWKECLWQELIQALNIIFLFRILKEKPVVNK